MPKPKKCRHVCALPETNRFGPLGVSAGQRDTVEMAIDEYETIRLIDLERMTQEECAIQMDVSRTTIQGIYDEARKKLADALVNGKCLIIAGGHYRLCDEVQPGRRGRVCHSCWGRRGNGRV